MLVYIITDNYDGVPIIAATSHKEAEQQLFDYMGYKGKDTDELIYKGCFTIDYSEFQDSLICIYTFQSLFPEGFGDNIKYDWETQEFKLYCLELNASQK